MAHPLAKVENFSYPILDKELIISAKEKELEILLNAYLDDFWNKGLTLLPPADGGFEGSLNKLFERRYVFRNVIKEVVGRVVGAFYGKPPNWKFQAAGADLLEPDDVPANTEEGPQTPPVPANPPQGTLDLAEIDKALNHFFVRQNVMDEMGKAFAFRLAFGRGSWRLYIPTKFKRLNAAVKQEEGGASSQPDGEQGEGGDYIQFKSIQEAIGAMRLEFVPPNQGRLLDDGGEYFSLVKYKVRHNWETHDTLNVIEFSFVDDSELTYIGTIGERSSISKIQNANLSSPFQLGGLTTLGEFKGQPYVTHALYKNNQLVNLALTCAGFSLVDNGFGEMVLTNVQLETKTVEGPDGEKHEVPTQIKRGGGAIQNFVGIDRVDEQTGTISKETPGVTFREPSPLQAFKDGYDLGYVACLQEAGQLYSLISGDATASGESRVQALADFLLKISPYKSEVDEQGSWLMTVVLLWAAELSGHPLPDHRVVYDSRMFVSALSDVDKQTVMTMRQKGTISRETERVLLGIDDPNLENELILREQKEPASETTIEDLSERADLGLKLQGLGVDQTTIQTLMGFTAEEIAQMQQNAADESARLAEEIRLQTEASGGGAGAGAGA